MVESKSFGTKFSYGVIIVVLALLALICFYPLWYTLALSLSSKTAANSGMVTLWPIGLTTASYSEIMSDWKFFHAFWVSIERTVLATIVTLAVSILMAYPLSKTAKDFKARNIIMWLLIFCMIFSGGLIPWYLAIKTYGLLNSVWALILGGSLPIFYVLVLMNFFRNIPNELEEAAVVDGAGPWTILFKIILPISTPVIATIILFTSVHHWNEFFNGLILMSDDSKYPLQTYIQQLVVVIPTNGDISPDQYKRLAELSNKSLNAAKVFISMIPMLAFYPFIQKHFVSGMMIGAVKG